jgi:hypothetical protein
MEPKHVFTKLVRGTGKFVKRRQRVALLTVILLAMTFGQMPGLAYAIGNSPAVKAITDYVAALMPPSAAAAQSRRGPAEISEGARKQIEELIQEKTSRTPAQRKISSRYMCAVRDLRGQYVPPVMRGLRSNIVVKGGEKVKVEIRSGSIPGKTWPWLSV